MVHLEKAIQEFSLKWPFILGILEEFLWGLISIEGAGCISLSVILVEVGSFMGVSQILISYFIIYCANGCFGETALSGCSIL